MNLKLLTKSVLILLLLASCNRIPSDVEHALSLAGNNRSELQKVLEHYSDKESKKFEAACFLISNMPYHKSKQRIDLPESYHSYFAKLDLTYQAMFRGWSSDSVLRTTPKTYDSVRRDFGDKFQQLEQPEHLENSVSDIEIISADFLIDHIDYAFELWKSSPLLQGYKFEEFKEFILPYRSTNEELLLTRREIAEKWLPILGMDGFGDVRKPIDRYRAFVGKCRWYNQYSKPSAHAAIYDLILPKFRMNCHSLTNWSVNIFRSCGIPVVYEYTPQWKDRSSRHFWAVSPDSAGIWQPYTIPDNNLGDNWKDGLEMVSKVYRRTFAVNPRSPYFMRSKNEFVPEEFLSPLLSDQTHRYHRTVTLRLPIDMDITNKIAFLGLLGNDEPNPVAWGIIDHGNKEIVFEQVPIETVFVPFFYTEDGTLQEISAPFILERSGKRGTTDRPAQTNYQKKVIDLSYDNKSGKLIQSGIFSWGEHSLVYHEFIPRGAITEMNLTRKYPEKPHLKAMQKGLKGSLFIGIEGELRDTLAYLEEEPVPYLQEIDLNNTKAYQYYRFYSGNGGPIHMAEMEFLAIPDSEHRFSVPAALPIFSHQDTAKLDSRGLMRADGQPLPLGSHPQYVYDRDIYTVGGNSRTGMDFITPIIITHVRFIPRTANNGIIPGQRYRLYFHDGVQWKVHAEQTARFNYVSFKNIPAGTVYWLQNLNDGKEELPFVYRNGKQEFIHIN